MKLSFKTATLIAVVGFMLAPCYGADSTIKTYDQTTATDSAMYYEWPYGYIMHNFFPIENKPFTLKIGPFFLQLIIENVGLDYRDQYVRDIKKTLGNPYDFSTGDYCRDSLYHWPIFEDFKSLTGHYDLGEIWMNERTEWYTLSTGCINHTEVMRYDAEPIYWIHVNYIHVMFWREYYNTN